MAGRAARSEAASSPASRRCRLQARRRAPSPREPPTTIPAAVIPSPAWVSYAPQANIVGRNVRWLHTTSESNWCLTPELLESLCKPDPERPRIVILNYPSNPTGGSTELRDLKRLADHFEDRAIRFG